MIYTITPNPALDLGGTIEKIVPNEKTYVHHETRFPGGNAINAARMIKKFGKPVIASGFIGGSIGNEITSLLKSEGVPTQFIQIQGHTRINVTVSTKNTHLQTRFSFPGPQIQTQDIQHLNQWIQKLSKPALIVIGGSLPPGFNSLQLRQILQNIKARGILFIVDVPGNILKKVVSSKPYLIKPNLIEFQELIGKKVTSIQDVTQEAKKLSKNIPFICVSSVEKGALLITPKNNWFGQIPPLPIKTTVGAGDAMIGAMTAQIWKSKEPPSGDQLLRWGLAAAAATLITPGTMLGEYKKILYYYPKIKITKIS